MIDYKNELNPAQYEAAVTLDGPVLVIAGAGSGKTRTIVYRLARLVESGVPSSSILLLTFTRKASQEMLDRARALLSRRHSSAGRIAGGGNPVFPDLYEAPAGRPVSPTRCADAIDEEKAYPQAEHARADADISLGAVQGGTFHAYAYSVLRLFTPEGYGRNLTVMDGHDITSALQHCKEERKCGKGDRSFPRNQTVQALLSKSRNKELSLEEIIRRDASHLLPHAPAIQEIGEAYAEYKRSKGLLDYDDLLFRLEDVLLDSPDALRYCRNRHQYIMVDEYQDTNPVQARIAALVAGLSPESARALKKNSAAGVSGTPAGTLSAPLRFDSGSPGNIMVVGDDAQSIYAFRGADVRNILRFPDIFPGAKLIRLEENYRSTQPVLDLANAVLDGAVEGFAKRLYTRREGSLKPGVIRPLSDRSEAGIVAARVVELTKVYPPGEVAVLFRAGFHSYALELQLNKLGLRFRKYGGIRYAEAAHIKDVLSFPRLVLNPLDFTAFVRMAELSKGVGARTCMKLYNLLSAGDVQGLAKATARFPELAEDLAFIERARAQDPTPAALLSQAVDHYTPRMRLAYPDDYPRRSQGLDQLVQIASNYADLDLFIADLSLDEPVNVSIDGAGEREGIVLSTIHSAKGLEWSAVLILDLVEERFPSRHALARPDDFEEERRLMYVACTRAKDVLDLYVPAAVYDRGSGGSIPAVPSPFVREFNPALYSEWQEGYTGALTEKTRRPAPAPAREMSFTAFGERLGQSVEDNIPAVSRSDGPAAAPETLGFCRHKIFGRGKIVQFLPPDKYRVNFPGIGLKVIMAAYLSIEQ